MRLLAELAAIATAIAWAYLVGWTRGYDEGVVRVIDDNMRGD